MIWSQGKDFAHVLSDDYLNRLSKQPTVEEMFGGVGRRLAENQLMPEKQPHE
jgi:hypothetical protein